MTWKRGILLLAALAMMSLGAPVWADTALQGDLSLGADIGLAYASEPFETQGRGGFDLALQPMAVYFPIDNLGFTFRFGWERAFVQGPAASGKGRADVGLDLFPLQVGARYYFPIPAVKPLRVIAGLGFGLSILHTSRKVPSVPLNGDVRFNLGVHSGIEYEIYPYLAFHALLDCLAPNLPAIENREKSFARFGLLFGFHYYLPT